MVIWANQDSPPASMIVTRVAPWQCGCASRFKLLAPYASPLRLSSPYRWPHPPPRNKNLPPSEGYWIHLTKCALSSELIRRRCRFRFTASPLSNIYKNKAIHMMRVSIKHDSVGFEGIVNHLDKTIITITGQPKDLYRRVFDEGIFLNTQDVYMQS